MKSILSYVVMKKRYVKKLIFFIVLIFHITSTITMHYIYLHIIKFSNHLCVFLVEQTIYCSVLFFFFYQHLLPDSFQ